LVQNSPKVTKKVLVSRKVARSCSLTEKLLKILKVAKKLPSRIWKGLQLIEKDETFKGICLDKIAQLKSGRNELQAKLHLGLM